RVLPLTVWLVGPFVVGVQVGLFQLNRKTQVLLPPRQWFAVRKYGVPLFAQLLMSWPVQRPEPPTVIMATLRIWSRQGSPSGQITLLLQLPLVPRPLVCSACTMSR